jgi:NAD(P)H-dependent flavin oxidoreductase YrpB (nitropropane dioxygenase family)
MRNPLHTKLCDRLGIEYPVVAFTHCKDVAVAVINAGGFAVLGEAMHPPEQIAADIKWIRERMRRQALRHRPGAAGLGARGKEPRGTLRDDSSRASASTPR